MGHYELGPKYVNRIQCISVLVFVENAWDQSNKQGILLSTALMVGWNYSESYNLRVELNQMGLGRGFFFSLFFFWWQSFYKH